MIRHQKQEMHPPFALRIVDRYRFEKLAGNIRVAQLIVPADSATDGNEEDSILSAYPYRRRMRKRFALWLHVSVYITVCWQGP